MKVLILMFALFAWAIYTRMNRDEPAPRPRPTGPPYPPQQRPTYTSGTTRPAATSSGQPNVWAQPGATVRSNGLETLPNRGRPGNIDNDDVLVIRSQYPPSGGTGTRPGQKSGKTSGSGKSKRKSDPSAQATVKARTGTHRLVSDVETKAASTSSSLSSAPPAISMQANSRDQLFGPGLIMSVLRSPMQLKQSMVLAEILKPPVSLRDPRNF